MRLSYIASKTGAVTKLTPMHKVIFGLCYYKHMLNAFKQSVDEYVKGKSWYWFVPFWLFGLYLFIKLFDFSPSRPGSFFLTMAQGFDFLLHEMSHLFMAFAPPIVTAASGSGSELLLGLILIVTAFWVRSYFASLFCFLWFMMACFSTAIYMADARAMNLSLVSFGGGDPIHDWNFIFGKLGLLEQDILIANIFRGIGIAAGVFGLSWSAWLIYKMIRAKAEERHKALMDEIMSRTAKKQPEDRPANKPFIGGDLYPTPTTGALANREAPNDKTITKN